MKKIIQEILQEYPNLEGKDLQILLENFQKNTPNISADPKFKKTLAQRLEAAQKMKSDTVQQSYFSVWKIIVPSLTFCCLGFFGFVYFFGDSLLDKHSGTEELLETSEAETVERTIKVPGIENGKAIMNTEEEQVLEEEVEIVENKEENMSRKIDSESPNKLPKTPVIKEEVQKKDKPIPAVRNVQQSKNEALEKRENADPAAASISEIAESIEIESTKSTMKTQTFFTPEQDERQSDSKEDTQIEVIVEDMNIESVEDTIESIEQDEISIDVDSRELEGNTDDNPCSLSGALLPETEAYKLCEEFKKKQ